MKKYDVKLLRKLIPGDEMIFVTIYSLSPSVDFSKQLRRSNSLRRVVRFSFRKENRNFNMEGLLYA